MLDNVNTWSRSYVDSDITLRREEVSDCSVDVKRAHFENVDVCEGVWELFLDTVDEDSLLFVSHSSSLGDMLSNLIVPVLNRYDLLERMLDSITYPVGRLLIIDNGGGFKRELSHDYVDETTILRMPSNMGVGGSWNLGVMSMPHEPYWAFASNDVFFRPGALATMADTQPDDMFMSISPPYWQAFTVGENVIRKTGLWAWGIYPAYYEDNDFERRARHHGFKPQQAINVGHDNSSTIGSDAKLQEANQTTFRMNRALFEQRRDDGELREGLWDLDRRRALEWIR